MSDLFQKAAKHLQDKLPFVVYSKPNEAVSIGIFQNDDSLNYTADFTEIGFVFAPFEGDKFVLLPENDSQVCIEEHERISNTDSAVPTSEMDAIAKENFENLVQKGIDAIHSGDFKKVVLSRKESVLSNGIAVFELFQKLLSNYPTAFKYCFFHPKVGLWLGATPEQLLQVAANEIKTVALAGTQVYKEGEIIWENKEQEEQRFVTEFILDSLQPFVSNENASDPYTFRAGNIVHIKTDISAQLANKKDLGEIIKVLHPTPAVCGLPKKESKDFILANEGYDRGYYSGFLGELNKDFAKNSNEASDLFVNLRCMNLQKNTANLYIGCGITKDSIPEKEFFETVNKSSTMKKILA